MRTVWTLVHRYVGLAIAAFIAIAGLTGSVLAYMGPLQEVLVGDRYAATAVGAPLAVGELGRRVEAHAPAARIEQWPLHLTAGREAVFSVAPKGGDASPPPAAAPLGYDAVHVDPVSGAILGTSNGVEEAPPAARVLDFIYSLHTSLALPGAWTRGGTVVMGVAALLWFFDCFVGAWLTLPKRPPRLARWSPAWRVKPARLNFDLHRAGGLWFFALLATLALSSVQMNLNDEVFMPVARTLLDVSPDPLALEARHRPGGGTPAAALTPQAAVDRALREAARRHWVDLPERMQHDRERGVYRIVFTTPPSEWTTAVRRELYLDDREGDVVAAFEPGRGTTGDALLAWLGALHVGSVFGWPYKLLLCVTGLAVGMLSVTGVVIWWRKRRGRRAARRHVRAATAKADAAWR